MKERLTLEYALFESGQQSIAADKYLEQLETYELIQPRLLCPVCRETVIFARRQERGHHRHFVHVAGEHALCPLVNPQFPVTTFLRPHAYDADVSLRHRHAFAGNWQRHLAEMRRLAPGLTVRRFVHAVEHADVLRVWSCRTIADADVPYVLLALASFVAQSAGTPQPQSWLRFVFDASVKDVGDFGRLDGVRPRFFRLHYRASPGSMFPNANQLLDWCEVPMSGEFLLRDQPVLSGNDVVLFARFIEAVPQTE
ncbi:hypothetical protein GCM10027093_63260 [Paraburkholderia jirisanensis]